MASAKKVLCTLGPTSLNARVIGELTELGVAVFRLNLSHTRIEDLEKAIRLVQSHTRVPICVDTEGGRFRTGEMGDGVVYHRGHRVRLVPSTDPGDGERLPIRPEEALPRFKPGTRLSVDYDSVVLEVDHARGETIEARVLSGGQVESRKAVSVHPSPRLAPFTEKDLLGIRIAKEAGVSTYAVSFCESPVAVTQLRGLVGPKSTVMAKIESREGVRELGEIAPLTDGIIIDRGDLSREIRLEAVPLLQKTIIRRANALGVPVYVATNLLESMVTRRAPTRAEVNDVMNTLLDGADGLILAGETALGKYPVEATRWIVSLIREYEAWMSRYNVEYLLGNHPLSTLPPEFLPDPE